MEVNPNMHIDFWSMKIRQYTKSSMSLIRRSKYKVSPKILLTKKAEPDKIYDFDTSLSFCNYFPVSIKTVTRPWRKQKNKLEKLKKEK